MLLRELSPINLRLRKKSFQEKVPLTFLLAMTDVYVGMYRPQDIYRNPQLAKRLVSELSHHLLSLEQMITINSVKKIETRLKGLLTMLRDEVGHPVEQGIRLTALGEWKNQNIIEFDLDHHLIIKF